MKIIGLSVCATALMAVLPASAQTTFEQITPVPTTYTLINDYNVASFGPTTFDVTASVFAVVDPMGGNLSIGCTASDYAGFAVGSIALIGRGTCLFATKVGLAQAAGASGVLIRNSAMNAGLPAPGLGGFDPSIAIPTFSTTFELGQAFLSSVGAGTLVVRMAANSVTPPPSVPEPTSWAMLVLGFGTLGYAMRRRTKLGHRIGFA